MLRMLSPLEKSTIADGSAAAASAKVAGAKGFVLQAGAMKATFAERAEQINSLLKARTPKNGDAVAEDLRSVLLTVHVPKVVEDELERAVEQTGAPFLMRLSPIGEVASPLDPTIVLGLQDMKSALDALRMLYAEMFTARNLAFGGEDRSAAIIVQKMPIAQQAWRVIIAGEYTILEGTYGYGAWVNYGEPERFLYQGDTLIKQEMGDEKGVFWKNGFHEELRRHVIENDAKDVLAFARRLTVEAPLLLARDPESECQVLGCVAASPEEQQ